MGEAKRRGSFEDRKVAAVEKDKETEKLLMEAREKIDPNLKRKMSKGQRNLLATFLGLSIMSSSRRRLFNAYFK
jgi:hypothetical protein